MDKLRDFGLKLIPENLKSVDDTFCTLAIEHILLETVFSAVLIVAVGNDSRDEDSFFATLDHIEFA